VLPASVGKTGGACDATYRTRCLLKAGFIEEICNDMATEQSPASAKFRALRRHPAKDLARVA
jgi:hypothetical protein